MQPADDGGPRLDRALAMVPTPGRAATRSGTPPRPLPDAVAACRWCGRPAAWSWAVAGDASTGHGERLPDEECPVCADCQALTLAGDDAALLDRAMALLAGRVPYPYASAFVRERLAAMIAHWITRRTTCRPC